jgi:hypothetical protein
MLYPSHYRAAFASSDFSMPPLHGPALRLACQASVFSPYRPTLALNRTELPEGSSCHHLDPFRYVVREASHPVISATVARSRRVLMGIHQVFDLYGFLLHYQTHTITRLRVATNAGAHLPPEAAATEERRL